MWKQVLERGGKGMGERRGERRKIKKGERQVEEGGCERAGKPAKSNVGNWASGLGKPESLGLPTGFFLESHSNHIVKSHYQYLSQALN